MGSPQRLPFPEWVLLPGWTDSEAAQKASGLILEQVQTDTGFPKITFGKVVKISSVQRGGGSGGGGGGSWSLGWQVCGTESRPGCIYSIWFA